MMPPLCNCPDCSCDEMLLSDEELERDYCDQCEEGEHVD